MSRQTNRGTVRSGLSKVRTGVKAAGGPTDARRIWPILVALVMVVSATLMLGARGSTRTPNGLASAGLSPQGSNPSNPSKEYIYAGRRLVATEEPTATPTPPPTEADTVGLFAPPSTFFLRFTNTSGTADVTFNYNPAPAGDPVVPLVGDWNGDGIKGPGIYDSATGTFYLRNSNSAGPPDITFAFGVGGQGWIPIVGDWLGGGIDRVGLYVPSSSTFFLKYSFTGGAADNTFTFGVGGQGWVPITGDWDGNGTDTVGLYVPASGTFYLENTFHPGAADVTFAFGVGGQGWVPITGDWDGNHTDTPGLYVPSSGGFFLRNSNTSGVADISFFFGPGGVNWIPLAGKWH